ncbi:hypothetical protein [Qipengyuania sp. RANM35]|uniref:hypothetical protein n=1 Tax=Qipengyuania sp. RANM35 TaxID=3068635 RepID=UPI0034DB68D8
MKFRIALAVAATVALAACGSTEDASTAAEADTVEIPADEALTGVDATPVADEAATATEEADDAATTEEAAIQEAGDKAADTAAEAMDAMAEDTEN